MNDIHLICAADLHLGRQVGPRNHRSFVIQAWERLVETCLNTKSDALLLAGDLIDQEGLFIEMHGVLRKGIMRLHEQGILVLAIAGNHDAKVLDQFNRVLGVSGFSLLGADGCWERKSFQIRGKRLHVDGISFADSFMKDNPLASRKWDPVPDGDALIGLLHCDVDVAGSKYAPVRSSDFTGLPHHAWILGHIHTGKEIRSANPWVQYCGSLQGLDIGPSECGARGAWKLTIHPHGAITSEFLDLAPLRWEQVRIDCSGISPQDWEDQLLKQIETALVSQIGHSGLEMVGARLKLEGRTPIYRELRSNCLRIQEQQGAGVVLGNRWVPYFLESIENNTRPELDLQSLAEGKTVVAILAKKLLQAQVNPTLSKVIYDRLTEKFRADSSMRRCEHEHAWPEEEEALQLYLNAGYALLEHMQNEIKQIIP